MTSRPSSLVTERECQDRVDKQVSVLVATHTQQLASTATNHRAERLADEKDKRRAWLITWSLVSLVSALAVGRVVVPFLPHT